MTEYKYIIKVEWLNGQTEEIDGTDNIYEVSSLINEYQMAFNSSIRKIWWEE